MVDYPDAEEHFVPRDFMFDHNAHSAIVIHKTAGDATPEAVLANFLNSANDPNPANRKRSSHFAVGQDGRIFQFVPEELGAGANGIVETSHAGFDHFWDPFIAQFHNLNTCTLSIEHCDPDTHNRSDLTSKQKEASFKLVAHLVNKFRIPASHIKTHNSIAATECPGNYPMDELRQFIQTGGFGLGVPAGWHDDGTTLVAPNGVHIMHGFRTWVLSHDWDANNLPLGPEFGRQQLEDSNPSLGGGTQMIFRLTMLGFTQQRGVFQEFIGQELLQTRQQIAALSAQVQQLKHG